MFVILGWILFTLAASAMVFWIIVAVRVRSMLADRPTVRSGLELSHAQNPGKLSIIIPAHNEERAISACVESLRAQTYPNLEIIFVLDRCADRTLDILSPHAQADPRIIIIENDRCPDDWAGKCNAARLGAERATGEWLLFTDADTEFDPQLCHASVALASSESIGLLSILSSLRFEHRHERVVQPVASMHLVRMYPFRRAGSDRSVRPFANGQFMLFDRDWYEKIGGHAAVKDDLLEDLAFARLLQCNGGRGSVVLADGMLRCSMYDTMDAMREGWKRIFIEACRRKPARLRKYALRIMLSGVGVPTVQIAAVIVGAMILLRGENLLLPMLLMAAVFGGILVQAATLVRIYRAGGAPASAIAAFPVGCWIVARLMLDGARDLVQRRPVRWGGRQYVLEPR